MGIPTDFLNRLFELIESEDISVAQAKDLIEQIHFFEDKRKLIESHYNGKSVAVCGGQIFVGDTSDEAIEKSKKMFPNKLPYLEEKVIS